MIRVLSVQPLTDFLVHIVFTDRTERTIDVAQYFHGPIFEQLRADTALFRSVAVDREFGTICWSNGADLDPDVLYGIEVLPHEKARSNSG